MTAFARLRGLDSRGWRAATWFAPLVTQFVLALVIVGAWLLGKWFPGAGAVPLVLVSLAAILPVCAVTALVLAQSAATPVRGAAVSIMGAYAVVFVGAAVYAIWIL
ncbi:hypothetical protein [Mycolicibacterium vaccae]|uniref:hypothetical protein n=1 Tax=Mycolicibacterium vaccae TaxID=1810 RepID=UPI003D00FE02